MTLQLITAVLPLERQSLEGIHGLAMEMKKFQLYTKTSVY